MTRLSTPRPPSIYRRRRPSHAFAGIASPVLQELCAYALFSDIDPDRAAAALKFPATASRRLFSHVQSPKMKFKAIAHLLSDPAMTMRSAAQQLGITQSQVSYALKRFLDLTGVDLRDIVRSKANSLRHRPDLNDTMRGFHALEPVQRYALLRAALLSNRPPAAIVRDLDLPSQAERLVEYVRRPRRRGTWLASAECLRAIIEAFRHERPNVAALSQTWGVNRSSLHRRLKIIETEFGVELARFSENHRDGYDGY